MNNILFISHRINTIEELRTIPENYGIEVDIRDYENKLVLCHDPFLKKESIEYFDDYLKHYKHAFIILNIKSEGIEWEVKKLLNIYNITNYFFLDSSFPMIYKLLKQNETNIAIRYSEYESLPSFSGNKPKYVWVDCFTQFPLNKTKYDELIYLGYKLCYVSPELQGQVEKIELYKKNIQDNDLIPNMICTKIYHIKKWL